MNLGHPEPDKHKDLDADTVLAILDQEARKYTNWELKFIRSIRSRRRKNRPLTDGMLRMLRIIADQRVVPHRRPPEEDK